MTGTSSDKEVLYVPLDRAQCPAHNQGMILRDVRRRAKVFLGPSIALCLVLYFAYHLIEGGRGIRAWRTLEEDVDRVTKEHLMLKQENEALQKKVSLLKNDICPHLLEEEARKLGYVKEEEVVVLP